MARAKHGITDFHVYNRGCRRLVLFKDDDDCETFLRILKGAAAVTGCVLWAYVIMNNHFHLALRASSPQLSQMMFRVGGLYSRHHNRKYGFVGHAFQGPYEAHAVGTLPLLLGTIAYIALNPVAARMVAEPEDYPWSSYRDWAGSGRGPLEVNPLPVLTKVSSDLKQARAVFMRIFHRERRRLEVKRKPVHTVSDVQAGLFEWLKEEAELRRKDLQGHAPLALALHWAEESGLMRGALRAAFGGRVPGTARVQLCRLRQWLKDTPGAAARLRLG
ncbi:MAG TPA: transposase [Planctomycetota bacterium]|nr:transposase [Planctomycetota bacterium]